MVSLPLSMNCRFAMSVFPWKGWTCGLSQLRGPGIGIVSAIAHDLAAFCLYAFILIAWQLSGRGSNTSARCALEDVTPGPWKDIRGCSVEGFLGLIVKTLVKMPKF